ncbi:MAG: tetratricopeptide repeat protein [Bryobacteraceae bacterium]
MPARSSLRALAVLSLIFAARASQAPQTAEHLNREATAALAAGKVSVAISEMEIAARRFPANTHIQFNLGLALVRSGRLEEAIAPLKKAARDSSLAPEAHFLLGADYFESKEYDKAVAELSGLVHSSHSARVLYMIEESNRRTGHVEQAETAFHELITRHPDSAWVDYLMGNAYEDQKQFDKAIGAYKQALQKDPGIPDADFAIGYIYWREQDTADAREWLEKEARRSCHALANFYLGEIARSDRDLHQAEARYRRALECDPSNSDAHLRLGIVLADQKRYKEAIAQLKKAVRLQPNGSSAHYHLAEVYSQLGRIVEAKAEYKKVRQILAAKDKGVPVSGMATRQ